MALNWLRNGARTCYRLGRICGLDPFALRSALSIPRFFRDWQAYQRRNPSPSLRATFGSLWPVLSDFDAAAGETAGHYFHQDLWAAGKIYAARPSRHVDIGSRLDG